MKINGEIWIVAEQVKGNLKEVSYELLGKAKELAVKDGFPVTAVVMGSGIGALPADLIAHGADKVILIDAPRLLLYQNDIYALVLENLIRKYSPGIVLFSASYSCSELSATVGAKLRTGVAAHSIDLYYNEQGELVQVVPAFGGRVLGEIFCPLTRPIIASIKPGVFKKQAKDTARQGEIIEEPAAGLEHYQSPLKAVTVVQEHLSGVPLEDAEIVLAGGWGVGSAEVWQLLEKLAQSLHGAVGCTRPALDEGWAKGEHELIGVSGKTIRPKVYIGFGISGATHHVVGIKDSGVVINVNNDPNSPVFQISDYGVAADVKELLPKLLEKIEEAK
ncbi:electron transfer flavoprotein subunit alpha/FixB family protein [Pelotomaculum propionicicum]|uniref:Caffeyl-CoA reductase-Etf complex subunit CarE n=1 Tax=Pelotomaculum propionicicum TaxID=258475 RepID=A0A4Y7RJT9_9FIRM|nr:electron transfer flavoprotein subunit alpha/FixB family protein [Pelotomaculum propionicicum]NLI13294.1 electron transfer flavoprotein subunit alpha/FixB family protein [Peptococcaceae bacterium]TEB09071.1 Caffeyl-CoA reductase-Etf complex subunit CarE [Pelotomaculum propionicicum]